MDKLDQIVILLGIGVLATWGRLVLSLEQVTLKHFIRVSVTGGLVGVCLGLGVLEDTGLAPWIKYCIFGIAVSLAEDILAGLLNVGKQWRDDPRSFFEFFRRK